MKSTLSVILGSGITYERVLFIVTHLHLSLLYYFMKTLPLICRKNITSISVEYYPHYNVAEYMTKMGSSSWILA